MTRTIKFDQDHKMLKDDILRDQMNYAEQKIHEVFYMLTSSYRDDIVKCREEGAPVDQARESKEYLLYQETLNGALLLAKNEIRRAFKENGFEELSPQEFSDYVKGKAKLLISMAREYTRARYPFETMIVPMEWRFNRLPEAIIESIAVDLFCKAKQIKQTTDEKIENLCSEYDRDMEELEKA